MGEPPSIPVIDLSFDDDTVRTGLLTAYGEIGFGYLVGHGVPDALIDDVFDVSRRFHALPLEAKLAIELDDVHRGYIPINTSTDRNSELADVTRPNQSASFMMMREAGPDDPDVRAGAFLAGPNQWPDAGLGIDDFRPTVERYHQAMVTVASRVVDHLLRALGQHDPPPGAFDPPTTWLRLLHYPPQPPEPDLYGSAPHIDYGAITLLAQDDVGGLQVQSPDGMDWIDVAPKPGAFVLNTGSMMRRWSNNRLRATPHRVINRSGRERFSVPFFFDPSVNTVVEPLPSCVSAERPARYEPLDFGEFLRSELVAGYDRHATQ
jgi:isopenicillin N synthase-like dioxygenase